MATRTFCDHCGNTITNQPNIMSFGLLHALLQHRAEEQAWAQQAMMAARAGHLSGHGMGPRPTAPDIKIEDVDLCNTCVPIWLERVRNLCKQSDV